MGNLIKAGIIRRRKRDTDQMDLVLEVQRGRRFYITIPDGVPFDSDDADRIYDEIRQLEPSPDEIQMPVADGLGGLVCDCFMLEYWNDPRDDFDIMIEFEDAVRRGLINRAFRG